MHPHDVIFTVLARKVVDLRGRVCQVMWEEMILEIPPLLLCSEQTTRGEQLQVFAELPGITLIT
jgi:hypothetical protein